jgi:anti-anti-sigma factor
VSNLHTQAVFSAEQGRLHLRLGGEMDLGAQPLLDKTYSQLVAADPGDLTVDLTHVTFLASNGLGFLAQAREHLHATGHTVTLHGPDRAALRALHIMGFDQYFTIE